MTDLQEVTGVNFEIILEKFQQDLDDLTRNQKGEVSIVYILLLLKSQFCFDLKR